MKKEPGTGPGIVEIAPVPSSYFKAEVLGWIHLPCRISSPPGTSARILLEIIEN